MQKVLSSLLFLTLILGVAFCAPAKKGKGGRQQPKKGPMPCPLKDC